MTQHMNIQKLHSIEEGNLVQQSILILFPKVTKEEHKITAIREN